MTYDEFKATLADAAPPQVPAALAAMWHDACGDWDRAHGIAQDIDDAAGAWVHAYLHRREGDESNAAYWYRRAKQPVATDPLEAEWDRTSALCWARNIRRVVPILRRSANMPARQTCWAAWARSRSSRAS